MSDRSEEEASARDWVRGSASILLIIDEHGNEQVSAVQQSRMRNFNQAITEARDDD